MTSSLDLLMAAATFNPQQAQPIDAQMQLDVTILIAKQTILASIQNLCNAFDSYRNLLSTAISVNPKENYESLQTFVVQIIAFQKLNLSHIEMNNPLNQLPSEQSSFQVPTNFESESSQRHREYIKDFKQAALKSLNFQINPQNSPPTRLQESTKLLRLLHYAETCTNNWTQCRRSLEDYLKQKPIENSSSSSSPLTSQPSSITDQKLYNIADRVFLHPTSVTPSNSSSPRRPIPTVMGVVVPHHPAAQFPGVNQNRRYLTVPCHNFPTSPQSSPIRTRKRYVDPSSKEPAAKRRKEGETHSYSVFAVPVTTAEVSSSSSSSSNQSLPTQEIGTEGNRGSTSACSQNWSQINFKKNPEPLEKYLKPLTLAQLNKRSIKDLITILSKMNNTSEQLDTQFLTPKYSANKAELDNLNVQQKRITNSLIDQRDRQAIKQEIIKLKKRMKTILSAGKLSRRSFINRRQFQNLQEGQLQLKTTRKKRLRFTGKETKQ